MGREAPLRFPGDQADQERPFVITGSYLQDHPTVDEVTRDGLSMTFRSMHRPLQAYTEALAGAGLVIERLREPTKPDPGTKWRRVPLFLHIRAARPAGAGR